MSVQARLLSVVVGLVAAALLLAACGEDGEPRSDDVLRIGMLVPLTGPAAVIGNPLAAGAQVWVDALNAEKGGIAGKYKVELVLRDTRNYDAATAVQAYEELKSEVAMFAVNGTTVVKALLPQLERDGGVAVAVSPDADWIREPNLIPVGVPYQIQAINVIDYYLRSEAQHRGGTVCAMVGDEAAGEATVEGVEFAAQELGFDFPLTAYYRLGDEDFTAQIRQLEDSSCDAVVLSAIPPGTSRVLSAAAQAGFRPRWLGTYPTWAPALAHSPLRQYLQDNFWLVREEAQYGDMSVPGMAELLARIERHPPSLDVTEGDSRLVNGYAQGQVMTAVLEQAVKEGDLSREGILRAIPRVGALSFDGLIVDYYYGPIEERGPEPESKIFEVDPAKPFGVTPIREAFKSEAAERFEPQPAR